MKRGQSNYTKYLDGMQESLNKNIQENIFPYWRNHNSLKGNVSFSRSCNKSSLSIRLVLDELSCYRYESFAQEASIDKSTEAGGRGKAK